MAELRDPDKVAAVAMDIRTLAPARAFRVMEVCGGHTAAIHRCALPSLLPDSLELLSGPGCPVCVTPNAFVDRAISLAQSERTIIATFGDLIRVPGSSSSLAQARARGADVRVVYSPMDAASLADENPDRRVVFLAVGFETTACTIASTVEFASHRRIQNFKLLSALKTMPAALRTLLTDHSNGVDGLILPGHVATITGETDFLFIAAELGLPCAISGFEPLDLLVSIRSILKQAEAGAPEVANCYGRAVRPLGNHHARESIARVFEPCDATWRGLGDIPASGLKLRPSFAQFDADSQIPCLPKSVEHPSCQCGEILRGRLRPRDCPLFGRACTPQSPIGACMVTSEGACAASFEFEQAYAQ